MEKNCFEKLVKRISVKTLDWFEAGFHQHIRIRINNVFRRPEMLIISTFR